MPMKLRFNAHFFTHPDAEDHVDPFEMVGIRPAGLDAVTDDEIEEATGPSLSDLRQAPDEQHRRALRAAVLAEQGWTVTSWVHNDQDVIARVLPAEGSAHRGVILYLQECIREHEKQARRHAIALEAYTRAADQPQRAEVS